MNGAAESGSAKVAGLPARADEVAVRITVSALSLVDAKSAFRGRTCLTVIVERSTVPGFGTSPEL